MDPTDVTAPLISPLTTATAVPVMSRATSDNRKGTG